MVRRGQVEGNWARLDIQNLNFRIYQHYILEDLVYRSCETKIKREREHQNVKNVGVIYTVMEILQPDAC